MPFGSPIHGLRRIKAVLKAGSAGLSMRRSGRVRAVAWVFAACALGAVLWVGGGVLVQAATTTLSSGTTTLSADALESNANDIVVDSGARLELNVTRSVNPTTTFTISGAGTVVKLGTETYGLGDHSNHVYFSLSAGGLLDIQAGRVMNNWGSATLSHFRNNQGSVRIAAGGTLDLWGEYAQMDALSGAGFLQSTYPYVTTHDLTLGVAGGSGVFSGVIRDKDPTLFTTGATLYLPLTVTKSGSGTQVFSGTNTYTGGTTVTAGSLMLAGGADRLYTGGAITASGGVLDLGGYSQSTSGNITLSGGTIQNGTLRTTGSAFELQRGTVSAILAAQGPMETNLKALLSFEGNLADGSSVGTHSGTWVGSSSFTSAVPSGVGAGGSGAYFDGATRVTLAGGDLRRRPALAAA